MVRKGTSAAAGPAIVDVVAVKLTAGAVMRRKPALAGLRASLFDALVQMRLHDVRGLPVIDPTGRLVGWLGDREVARQIPVPSGLPEVRGLLDAFMIGLYDQPVTFLAQVRALLETTSVEEAMRSPAIAVPVDATLEDAIRTLLDHSLPSLPVVDDGRLVGILTPRELLAGLVPPGLPRAPSASRPE